MRTLQSTGPLPLRVLRRALVGLSLLSSLTACGEEEESGGAVNSVGATLSDQGALAKSDDTAETDAAAPCEGEGEGGGAGPLRPLNLQNDSDNLYAWRKTRASLDPEQEVVFYWVGYIYELTRANPGNYPRPGAPTFESPLFRFEGFNVARFAEVSPGSYEMLSREVSVYQDPNSGEILDCWRSPLIPGRPSLRVLHVANDPVNFGVGPVSFVELGERVSFFSDVLLAYRSPLAGGYDDFSASDVYQSNELFNFYVDRISLEDESVLSAPVEISWSRVGQYLPWMQMGSEEGQLIYHVRGYKVLDGVEGLPQELLDWTRTVAGERFLHAPEEIPASYQPNATTWRVFKETLDSGAYTPSCD